MSDCNETYYLIGNTEVQYCNEGCEYAANEYANIVKGEIGTPTPPTLSSNLSDVTSVSIPLTWEDAGHPEVSYRIQWIYADDPSSIWRNYDIPPIKVNMLVVADLSPYVNYHFRVLWIITSLNYLYSNKSLPIQTLASGAPSSPPTIVSITSASFSSIEIRWQPPFFINGPIQMYRLTAQPVDGSTDLVIEEEPEEVREYSFRSLADGVAYTVTVQARNSVGLGPAASANITTLHRPTYEGVTPNLVVGVNNFYVVDKFINALTTFDITRLESLESANSVHELELDAAKLDGCAVYYTDRLYFFADDSGSIHRRAEMDNQSTIIYISTKHPKEMSVDWLYKKLYFIEDNQISRCDFDGGNIEVAVGNLLSTPTEIRVDPSNGYLFWSELNSGIYRLNLTNVVTNTNDKKLIIANSKIQAFYVHSTDKLLYYPDEAGKKIYSVNLQGTDQTLIKNISGQTFQNVTSLVRYTDIFFWVEFTTQDAMYSFTGKGDPNQVIEFAIPEDNAEFRGMVVDHPSSQPYPVPLQPENAQALFTNNSAVVAWDELAVTGSWQGWSYRVQAFNGNTLVSETNTSTNSAVLESLTASTSYEIRVIGFTPDGDGPASTPYRGETLQTAIPEPYLIAGTEQGIQRVGMEGSVQQPINTTAVNVEDIDWYGDIVIWSDSNEVSWTSISNPGSTTKINGISKANEIAVDWLGGQLYWAEDQEIKRAQWSTSDSSAVKPELVIESVALDIAVDSIRAYIYWISVPLYYNSDPRPSGVECARLNNDLGSRVTIYETEEFVEEQVVSLTLDLNGGFVYWLVRSGHLRVYKSVLADNNRRDLTPVLVTEVQAGIQSPTLHYYSNRFFWISMNQYIAVASVDGNSLATISSVSANALTIVQNSLHPVPDGFTADTVVIPIAILADSIKIIGEDAGNFNVEWNASLEVTYSQVFYNLKITVINGEIISKTRLTQPSYNMKNVAPYSQLNITVEAYTYYGLAPSSQSALRSPESVPSIPQNPRVFVSESGDPLSNDDGYEAEFRWEAPSLSNGILLGYNVYWGTSPDSLQTENITDSTTTTYKTALEPNTFYYFQVDAYTRVGSGGRTQLISTNTSAPTPVPTVLVFGASGFDRIDLDTNTKESIGLSDVLALGYIAQRNNMLYYIDGSDKSIKQAEENGDNPEEILEIGNDLDKSNVGFAVDWLAQAIYWTEKQNENSIIYFYDLTIGTLATKTEIVVDNNTITSLTVNPQGNQLIWSVTTGILKTSFYSPKNNFLMTSIFFQSGLPPDTISVDSSRLYWSKNGERLLSSVLKADGSDFQTLAFDAELIVALDSSMQPYPASECLAPLPYSGTVGLLGRTSTTLTLDLTPALFGSVCGEIVTAAVVYKLKYTDGTTTLEKDSTSTSVDLVDLTPYTDYSIQVSVSNYYSTGTPVQNSPVVFRTVEDVPSAVRNPFAVVLSPTEVILTWDEPETLNGDPYTISYDIEFEYTNSEDIIQTGLLVDVVRKTNSTHFKYDVDNLIPSATYSFKILAYSMLRDKEPSTAEVDDVTMFEMPGQLLVMETTNFSIQLNWTSPSDGSVESHEYQYKPVDSSWLLWGTVEATTLNRVYEVTIGNDSHPLSSNTQYEVRTKTYYASGRSSFSIANSVSTAAGLPGAPGQPSVESIQVAWKEADNNGAEIKHYILQASVQPDGSWYVVYTGADAFWIIANLTDKTTYLFRVAAVNDIGQGDFSIKSAPFDHISPTKGPITSEDNSIVIIVAVIVAVVLVLIIVVASFVLLKRRKKKPQQITVKFNSDTELAALRQYPQNLVKRDNQIYAVTNLENGQMVELPIFPRERLNLKTFLGSGAFGEVFEGQAEDILGEGKGITKVAVKTLRDKSTDQEKEEFLKEAVLMGNFKHPNILALLGVCLDNDPQYIILELMEGGDLLNYLRAGRGIAGGPAKLTLLNLIDIIIDVAAGCKYLESMHFVHRDIAARNCLVSTKAYGVEDCSVKIGDFGLARDVYKSDYYRKEGEGLLPVRWMPPEAIMDGVFTNFSDVWAFGIVLWEVLTLGQQPYPARSNVEVLQFVTEGGRLDSPENCPDDIYQLMIKCWSKQATSRPSFRSIVERLENFRRKSKAISGADVLGFETSAGLKLNYARIQPSADEYLDPITSKQSLVPDPPAFTDIDLSEPASPTDSGMGTLKDNTTDEATGEEGGGLKKKNSLRNSLRKMLPGSISGKTKERTPLPELSRPPPREFDNSKYSKTPRYGPAPVSRSGSKVSAISGQKPNYDEKGYNAELPPPPPFSTQSSSPVASRPAGHVRQPNPFRADSDEEQDKRKYINSSVINV
ncbi:proto-oncogene tyrosine-protein kinase ROS-like [Anneissia japonica]|uniref:proto-oncogene tyrosine-protein kinase ROS-like n=1 Tax=Anneissia japonica TaxID=1529436 RepID=UPI0014256995|nr:proto-oncogene tyrosine-protein kinase ROS-like [Anneissia japonica]